MVITSYSQHMYIPTTLEGPFRPTTRSFDPSLRRGSDDLPMDHPRLKRNVSSNFPDQIAIALSTPTSMWISWVTGDAKIGVNVTPTDSSGVASEVWYWKEGSNDIRKASGISVVYSQLYPFQGLWNYTSGIIHHVKIEGLEPEMRYHYKCGDSLLGAMSEEFVFETLPLPGSGKYPPRIAVVGDLGLTMNSTTTIDHLITNDPSIVLMVGDLTYANQYLTTGGNGTSCYSCAFPNAPIRETYQPRWDAWGRFMQTLTSRIPMIVIEGNHEIEPQISNITFQSYLTRFSVMVECICLQVHAYERMNRVYNYTLDSCGPVYITIGDGGNIEKIDVDHADEPGKCPSAQDNVPEIGGVCHMNFSSGPAKGRFCWDTQPEWSAYRESSFGHGILEVVNSTYALWTWHRNQDIYKQDTHGDQIYIVRQPHLCSNITSNGNQANIPTPWLPVKTFYITLSCPLLSRPEIGRKKHKCNNAEAKLKFKVKYFFNLN
ncbi:purple acid phosphatase 23-like [Henckelia pumila]|uniref:purple acid phosphatase 23-like n=1 Tax=Henckelia pumila TaxID=405737 RepID=UPI003C6DCE74